MLRLQVGARVYEFAHTDLFEFALEGRTGLSPETVTALVESPAAVLAQELERLHEDEEAVARTLEAGAFEDALRGLASRPACTDSDWPAILAALGRLGEGCEEAKRIGLASYREHLRARRRVAERVLAAREASGPMAEGKPLPAVRELTRLLGRAAGTAFARLPSERAVVVHLRPAEPVALLLGEHRFLLVEDGGLQLVDERGCASPLGKGPSVVGRDPSADVVLDAAYHGISRRHLVVEPGPDGAVRLTDVSRAGTSIARDRLDGAV